jgi:hypothetical protein
MSNERSNTPAGQNPEVRTESPPRPERLLAIIQFLAPHTDKVIFTRHAQERMAERDISDLDVYRVLQRGSIKDSIRQGLKEGEWACKITYKLRGSREIGVATVVIRTEALLVTTVEWEDK